MCSAREVLHQHAFGDFEFQALRRKSGFVKGILNEGRQVAMTKLYG